MNKLMETGSLIREQKLLSDAVLHILPSERQTLRFLAGQVAELAARPIEDEKRNLWLEHNSLKPTRPLIFCDPENSWHEIIPPESLVCQGEIARGWEFHLRREIFWARQMQDDRVIQPYFDIAHYHLEPDWGAHETRIGGEDRSAYRWESPINSEADLAMLHPPLIAIDFAATRRLADLANEIIGDLLSVRIKTIWWWTLGMTWPLANLRGLERIMYDMVDHPDFLHRLMTLLRDGTAQMLDALEQSGLLYLNTEGTYVGSGGFGWTDELPAPDFTGHVRTKDMWGFAESQETVGVSPRMFGEFIFPYQLSLLERFGLNCYGCCEPIDKRWPYIKQIPNLRRVSISPWSNRAKMAELLSSNYIYSLKPIPTNLAMPAFDEDLVRSQLEQDLRAARGCCLEIIMKDNNTIQNDPHRVVRWVQIAREVSEAVWQ